MKLRAVLTGVMLAAVLSASAVAQTSQGSSPLSGAKGGTNNSFMQFTGPATSLKTYTLPNASDTIATIAASQTLTNKTFNCANNTCTVRIGSDVTGLGTGIATFLATPSSANLRSALTDEVGTGAAYFVGGALGTPASATLTNATGLPPGGLAAQAAWSFIVNNTSGSATPTAVDIASLTSKASPAAGDYVILSDQAASGALKKATVSSVGSAGSVSSIAGNTGAFTLSTGITNSTNDIRLALNNATIDASTGNPTSTTSGTGVMMGIGGTCKITPVYSGRIKVELSANSQNTANAAVNSIVARYGTGTAPSNGVALTGTGIGVQRQTAQAGTVLLTPVTVGGIVTGLSPGTAYWFDFGLTTSTGTAFLLATQCTIIEF